MVRIAETVELFSVDVNEYVTQHNRTTTSDSSDQYGEETNQSAPVSRNSTGFVEVPVPSSVEVNEDVTQHNGEITFSEESTDDENASVIRILSPNT